MIMKKISLIFIVLTISTCIFAQDKSRNFSANKFSKSLDDTNGCEDCIVLDVTYDDWQGDRAIFQSPAASIGFNLELLHHFKLVKSGAISFGLGFGYSFYKNRSFLQYNRDYDKGTTTLTKFSDSLSKPSKVGFKANYIEIPIDFRFITKGKNHFKFMVGAKIGVNIGSSNYIVSRIEGKKYTTKISNFPDLNLWRYGVFARIGMRNISLFGAYYFSPIFKHSGSTSLYPFTLGISLSIF